MSQSDHPSRFALIIGAMKCGTTTLFDLLGQHPQVCPSKVKEPDYFTAEREHTDLSSYYSLFNWRSTKHRVAMEASVSYTKLPYFPGVAARISASEIEDVKLIYMMRHPLKRIESQARHALYGGWGKSFDEQIDPDLIAYSRYAMQLDEYRATFGRDALLPLFLDDLETEPEEVLKTVCEFLDIDTSFQFNDPSKRSNRGDFYSAWPLFSSVSESSWGSALLRRGLPAPMKTYVRNTLARLRPAEPESTALAGRWQLTADEKQTVWKELIGDMSRLQSDYGLKLPSAWHRQSE